MALYICISLHHFLSPIFAIRVLVTNIEFDVKDIISLMIQYNDYFNIYLLYVIIYSLT